jgi:hypothetical protein
MGRRTLAGLAAVIAVGSLGAIPLGGQGAARTDRVVVQPKPADLGKRGWTAPRTPDGQPDLQGYWTNATFTPLERPAELAGKEFFATEAEALAYEKQQVLRENSQSKDDIHYDNVIWQSESYTKGVSRRRTSLIFDPADGKVPPLSPAGQKRVAARAEAARRRGPADAAEYRSLGERCISWGNEGPPMLGASYYNNLQILQSATSVAIRHELMHGIRVIPLDGRPHVGPNIRLQGGDPRGHWEGNTLVVDTTNFTDRNNFRGPPATARQDIAASENLHVIERFTRADADSILYQFTLDDPATWTRPWSGEILIRKWEGPIYEYACHEGNYGLAFILSAARMQEKTNLLR